MILLLLLRTLGHINKFSANITRFLNKFSREPPTVITTISLMLGMLSYYVFFKWFRQSVIACGCIFFTLSS